MTSTVKGILQKSEKFSIKWKIERFLADCQQIGDCYVSPKFSVRYNNEFAKCYLKVYPLGSCMLTNACISIYICFDIKNTKEVSGQYQVTIMNFETNGPSTVKAFREFKSLTEIMGWSNFMYKDSLKSSNNTLINDTVTILCDVEFYEPRQDITESFCGWLDKTEIKACEFEHLLESGSFSDVTFDVRGEKINAHKAILSCRSPVFKAMFEHEMTENRQNSVDIKDIDHDVMKELFRFMYSGKIKNIEEIGSELLIAADKYQVIELKVLCEKTLFDSVTTDNVADYLKLTNMCETIQLKNMLINFVAANYKEIDKMPGLMDLSSKVMYEIMQAIGKPG